MYTEVNLVKKTESVTFRTTKQIKTAMEKIMAEKKWTLSQLAEEIIKDWLSEKRPDLLEEKTE